MRKTDRKKRTALLSLLLAALALTICMAVPAFAAEKNADPVSEPRYTNGDTGYTVTVVDQADLFSNAEEDELVQSLKKNTKYGSAAVVTGTPTQKTAAEFAKDEYQKRIGDRSGSIMVFDMKHRIIQIYSAGDVYETVTDDKAEAITDNIYDYANKSKYAECARVAFEQEYQLLQGGRVPTPMKHATNLLIALTLAILVNFLLVWNGRKKLAAAYQRVPASMTAADVEVSVIEEEETGRRMVSDDDDDDGDSLTPLIGTGGFDSFGGGGFGGGSFGGGGGFSGGGGGHSF